MLRTVICAVSRKIKNKFKSKFSPMSFWGSYIIFPIKMKLRKIGFGNKYYKEITKLKNIHLGKRCFIIATGPSLTIDDVNLLKNEITIGINSIFKIFHEIGWVPTYYAMLDPNLTNSIIDNYSNNFDGFAKEKCFFNSINMNDIECNNSVYFDMNWLDHCYNYGKSNKFKYNPNPEFGIYDCYSITQLCVLIALYMGFKKIYIIGADNNYLGNKQHFSSFSGEPMIDYENALKMQAANDKGYAFVKKIVEENGAVVLNATRGGNIKCLKRVVLEDILEDNTI